MLDVQIKILDEELYWGKDTAPKGSQDSAAIDLMAAVEEDVVILPGETKLIPTGLAFYHKDPSFVGLVFPRSGLGHKHGIVLGNLTGVIDADYQGQLMVSLWNRNLQSSLPFTVHRGDRIAQYLFVPVERPAFRIVQEFDTSTARGEGGFGSTGVASHVHHEIELAVTPDPNQQAEQEIFRLLTVYHASKPTEDKFLVPLGEGETVESHQQSQVRKRTRNNQAGINKFFDLLQTVSSGEEMPHPVWTMLDDQTRFTTNTEKLLHGLGVRGELFTEVDFSRTTFEVYTMTFVVEGSPDPVVISPAIYWWLTGVYAKFYQQVKEE